MAAWCASFLVTCTPAGVAVAPDVAPHAAVGVEETAAADIEQVGAFAALDDDRLGLGVLLHLGVGVPDDGLVLLLQQLVVAQSGEA